MNTRRIKFCLIICFGIIVIMCIIYCVVMLANKKSLIKIQIDKIGLNNRSCIKIADKLYIGNNEREIENGFYDVCLGNSEEGICLYINKLWYQEYGQDYIQDEYLANICRQISNETISDKILNDVEYELYKYIKDNYKLKAENVELEKKELSNFSITGSFDNYVMIVKLQGE